jgi:transporter family protein
MALKETLRTRWFWYSISCVVLWGPFMIASKLGSREIPAPTMQFLFTMGSLPILLVLLPVRHFRLEKNVKGIAYGTASGIVAGLGTVALFAAYSTGGNTSVITAVISLYPVVTAIMAVLILREHLTWVQIVGLVFVGVALILFSL